MTVVEVVDPTAIIEIIEITDPDAPETVVEVWVPGKPGPAGPTIGVPIILLESDEDVPPMGTPVGAIIVKKRA